ncbi:MAG TPA: YwdI family protein [Bacillales bacterium]|nr:YwdI family protein [Bacillales bacterium]
MKISVQRLLAKIDEELKLAKSNVDEKSLRENVYSIKILCELILDEKQLENTSETIKSSVAVQQPYATSFSVMNQPKKLNDDDANGDSLFDF